MDRDIHHISDTALWIAAFRAQETERENPAFKDVLAKKLAGDRGMGMIKNTPYARSMAFAMVVRTRAIDKLVQSAIGEGVDTVINLGAGLDTRPYRMKLPSALKWIEVDFRNIIDYKNDKLKDDSPVCKLERIAFDLSEQTERKKLFAALASKTSKALVITEGVVGYLANEEAKSLAQDIYAVPAFNYWILDYAQGRYRSTRQSKKLLKNIKNVQLKFQSADPKSFFARVGWVVKEDLHILDEAEKIPRKLPLMFPWNLALFVFPKWLRKIGNQTYGYVMFEKRK